MTISEQFIIKTKANYPGMKTFATGMSLGGAVVFDVLLKVPNLVDGAILLNPSIRENSVHHPLLKKLAILFSIVFPYQKLLKQSGRNGSKYKLNHYIKKDPYIYGGRLYPKTVQEVMLAIGRIRH